MKLLKSTIFKIVVLLIVFVGTIALYFVLNHEEAKPVNESLEVATLPIVTSTFQGIELNALHGYTSEMEAKYMKDVITPLNTDRQLPITIYRYDNTIANISYELRSLDTTRLIENVSLDSWEVDEKTAKATLDISKIPNQDEEYLLIIKLTTEVHGTIYYYSRIMQQSESAIAKQLDFVNGFSESTLDDVAFENYIGNLEISPSRDNSNLADVDLTSSYNNLTWGNMKVERVSTPVVSITEICTDTTCFQLKYKVRALNDYNTYQYYDVTEFFRVRLGVNVTYLYVYDRTVEQIFDPINQNISTTRINLGLDSDLSLTYKTNRTGSYVTFVKNGSLWCMDMKENQITSIFSFEDLETADIRMSYDQYDIEIISTDDDGNTLFLVYGYMETGAHEGQVGVALYKYTNTDSSVKELVFVPSSKPFNILRDSVGKFAYLTADNLLYFMIGNSIYTVTMDSNEYMQLVTNLQTGNYIINKNNNILAWHENTSVYGADSIRIIDVDNKQDYTIKAQEDEYIKVIDFIENDLVYGCAKKTDVYTDAGGNTVFPMYKLNILYNETNDEETTTEDSSVSGHKVWTYAKDNVYVTSATTQNNTLNLKRCSKDESGSFVTIDDDKLVNRQAESSDLLTLDVITTALKKKELVLYFAYTITNSNALASRSVTEYEFTTANTLDLNDGQTNELVYYVYAYGDIMSSFKDLKSAIEYANNNFGMVTSSTGDVMWSKITKPDLAKLTDTTSLVAKGWQNTGDIIADSDYTIYDLTGTEFANVLYYGAQNLPVITYTNELGYVILSAYSSYLGMVDTIAFTDLQTGEITKLHYSDAIARVKEAGNIFLVLKSSKTGID